jgi:TonB family protein
VKEVVPSASPRALQTIQGTIKVSVRVNIDDNGAVSEATLVNAGPSKYFARLALEAAKQWTFTPAPADTSRTTLLRFDFTRAGVTANMIA